MSKHTPGPWRVTEAHGQTQVVAVNRHPEKAVTGIADIFDSIDGTEEWAANARLIAAAPVMLAVLEAVSEELMDRPEDFDDWMHAEIPEALHKARGET